jgi:enoyl-CoA hydratase/carnithine racemase
MDKMSQDKILIEKRDGGVVLLIINNPEKRNAMDLEIFEKLPLVLEALDKDDGVPVLPFD